MDDEDAYMWISDGWKDYELLDCGDGQRLERWGDILLIRPDPQILWHTERKDPRWREAHARYQRSQSGGGAWQVRRKTPPVWSIRYGELTFRVKPMGFKHTGVFPEQAVNWELAGELIRGAGRPVRVLMAAFFFGLMKTLASAYSGIPLLVQLNIPSDFYKMFPYIATLIVLAFTSKNSQAPKASGVPYDKGDR